MTPRTLLSAVIANRMGIQSADWAELAATFGDHVAPFAGLAPADEPATTGWQQQIMVEALGHLGTLREIHTWGLPFLVVKGLPWATTLWGDPFVRPAHDIDLIVADNQVGAWSKRLQQAGFAPGRSSLALRRGRQIVQLHHPSSRRHWLHAVQPSWADIQQRATTTWVADVQVRQPDPADTLLYLAHHQVFRHAFDHDLGWLDLAGWVIHFAGTWSETAVHRAAGSHLHRSLQVLHWAWVSLWRMPPFLSLPEPAPFVRLWAIRALRYSSVVNQTVLSFVLASPAERFALIQAAPAATRRLREWWHPNEQETSP